MTFIPATTASAALGSRNSLTAAYTASNLYRIGSSFADYLKAAGSKAGQSGAAPAVLAGASKTEQEEKPAGPEAKKLMDLCQQFEALFLFQMLQAMRKTIPETGFFGNSIGQDIYKSMLDEQYALAMAGNGSLGIAQALYDHLARALETKPADGTAASSHRAV